MMMKIGTLPFNKQQLSLFMDNVVATLYNASSSTNVSQDQSFYSIVRVVIRSIGEDEQAMDGITNFTKTIQGKNYIYNCYDYYKFTYSYSTKTFRMISGYMKRVEKDGSSLKAGKIDEAPDPLDLCRLRVGAGIAQYQHYLVNIANEGNKQGRRSKEKMMTLRTDTDIFKSVFWRKDGQKIRKVVYNDFIGQWVSQSVAKCSCENDMDKCPAPWGGQRGKGGKQGKQQQKNQNESWLKNYGILF